KSNIFLTLPLALALSLCLSRASQPPSNFACETTNEFFSSGDFDGDGRTDLVIVDKATGKIRIGYGSPTGTASWADCRITGLKGIAGFNIGKFISQKYDALA